MVVLDDDLYIITCTVYYSEIAMNSNDHSGYDRSDQADQLCFFLSYFILLILSELINS